MHWNIWRKKKATQKWASLAELEEAAAIGGRWEAAVLKVLPKNIKETVKSEMAELDAAINRYINVQNKVDGVLKEMVSHRRRMYVLWIVFSLALLFLDTPKSAFFIGLPLILAYDNIIKQIQIGRLERYPDTFELQRPFVGWPKDTFQHFCISTPRINEAMPYITNELDDEDKEIIALADINRVWVFGKRIANMKYGQGGRGEEMEEIEKKLAMQVGGIYPLSTPREVMAAVRDQSYIDYYPSLHIN